MAELGLELVLSDDSGEDDSIYWAPSTCQAMCQPLPPLPRLLFAHRCGAGAVAVPILQMGKIKQQARSLTVT